MSTAIIRKLLETRYSQLDTGLKTEYENQAFTIVKTQNWIRLRVQFNQIQPVGPGTNNYTLWQGVLMLQPFVIPNKGPKALDALIDQIRDHFPRGLSLTDSGVNVRIETPYLGLAGIDPDWYNIPIWIPWFAYIL